MTGLVLASGSPRRKVLLGLLVDGFEVHLPSIDETLPQGFFPSALELLARRKARSIDPDAAVVLAADTVVVHDGRILGKPLDRQHALEMLSGLNGGLHQVVTAFCVRCMAHESMGHVTSKVSMDLPADALQGYLESGKWQGKAGGYGLQDREISTHISVDGSWSNVVGLPLAEVAKALAEAGVRCRNVPDEAQLMSQNPF